MNGSKYLPVNNNENNTEAGEVPSATSDPVVQCMA
jgi:hypothetical protein